MQATTAPALGDDVRQLAAAARTGDATAWRALVDRYGGMLRAKCFSYRLSADDVSDVVQTTWLVALQHLDQLRSDDHVGGWLARIAERECLQILRRKRREPASSDLLDVDLPSGNTSSPEREIARSWLARILPGLVAQLPASQQALLTTLTGMPELNYVEVARIMGRPVGSIGPTRARTLARLRMMLESHEVDAGFLT
jgi:RNA polymerase sigma factor (sigma-70 family)